MIRDPVRADPAEFAAALNVTEALPIPEAVPVESHVSLEAAVHAHPCGAVTLTDPLPPFAGTDPAEAEREYEHPTPDCVTVNVRPAMVSVPVRENADVFAAAVNDTEPLPLPDAGEAVIQLSLLAAVH